MLPHDIEPRSFLGADALSHSELSTLSRCENQWALTYGTPDRERAAPSAAMELGKRIHAEWGHWWMTGEDWFDTDSTEGWTVERYARLYDPDRNNSRMWMLEVEKPFVFQLPSGTNAFGFIDGLADVLGDLWVVEAKSTANIEQVLHLKHSLQGKLYVAALRAAGIPVEGCLLDILSTAGKDQLETQDEAYKRLRAEGVPVAEAKERKKTERLVKESPPLESSFKRLWLRYSDEDLAEAVEIAEAAVQVRRDLAAGRAPLRNIGPSTCKGCSVVAPCLRLTVDIMPEEGESE